MRRYLEKYLSWEKNNLVENKEKKKKRKGRKKIKREEKNKKQCVGKKRRRNDTSLHDLQLTGSQNSSEQEAKLVYSIRAMCGVLKSEFFIEVSKGRGFLLY